MDQALFWLDDKHSTQDEIATFTDEIARKIKPDA